MKLENEKLIINQEEYNWIKKWNMMASPYIAGLYLYHELKRNNIEIEWDPIYFKNIYLAFRKKNIEIIN